MIPIGPATRIFLASGATDLRKNFEGLSDLVSHQLKEGRPKVAAIASIVETCRRLEINLRAYPKDVLPKLGDWPSNRVAELTPSVWKAAQNTLS